MSLPTTVGVVVPRWTTSNRQLAALLATIVAFYLWKGKEVSALRISATLWYNCAVT